MSKMMPVVVAAALFAAGAASAAEIRFAPAEAMTLFPTYEQHGYSDLLVHTVAIRTAANERLKVETIELALMQGDRVLEMRTFTGEEALAKTRGMDEIPIEGLRATQYLDPHGLAGWFGPDVRLAKAASLEPNQALLLTETYFAIDGAPDRLRVTVRGAGPDGPKTVGASIPVRVYRSKIDYRFPLRGAWLYASLPIMWSHHRFIPPNEFAADFFKVDSDGATRHDDSAKAENWYAYGQPVTAAADGVVVRAVADRTQDRAFLAHIPGESPEARGARVNREMERRNASDFPNSMLGNTVTIRHEAEGTVEYSSYMHLKAGSVRVKVGDTVRQGQVIAEVGDTGDTPVVHLHFQVNSGPEPFTSPSLPFRFSDLERTGSTQDPGYFVQPR
jgi:hypothetical protein